MKKKNLYLLAAGTALSVLLIGSVGPAAEEAYAETYSQNSGAMEDYLNFLSGQSSGAAQGITGAAQETTAAAWETTAAAQESNAAAWETTAAAQETTASAWNQSISFEEWAAYNQGSSSTHGTSPGQGSSQGPDVYSDPNAGVSGNPMNDTASGGSAQTGGTNQSAAASAAASTAAQGAAASAASATEDMGTAETTQKKRPFEPPVMGETPDKKAVSGGNWDQAQSGEWNYYLRDGSMAKNVWVIDQGKYYYIDYSGCMMRSNYSADGFWVLGDGSWDRTSEQRTYDQLVAAHSGRKYGKSPYLTFDYSGTGNGNYDFKMTKNYSFGYQEQLTARPVGYGVYILLLQDGTVAGQFSVSPERDWVIVTECGYTENYQLQN